MKILAFDSSSKALSVALLEDDQLMAETRLNVKKNHSISLMPTIDFLMDQVDWQPSDLERIAVAQGPGSYTGLRVAVATAKTLAYSLSIDLVAVSSLYALTDIGAMGLLIPIMDARRQHVYVGFYDNGKAVEPEQYASFEEVLSHLQGQKQVTFVGEVSQFQEQIKAALPSAVIVETLPSAALIGRTGRTLPAVDVHAFVPNYLKRVEAEENWLKTHNEGDTSSYIKRV
ncbi:tRNA (adenosine(37)-N6)-threonylcarbamoyltransferase complex dimerization subunit type 1 TsaB [Streptococcus dentiloxodontae]